MRSVDFALVGRGAHLAEQLGDATLEQQQALALFADDVVEFIGRLAAKRSLDFELDDALLLLFDLLAQHCEFGSFRHAPQLATLARLGDAGNDSRARDASLLDGLDLPGAAHSCGAADDGSFLLR
jgi:hypothetical protein